MEFIEKYAMWLGVAAFAVVTLVICALAPEKGRDSGIPIYADPAPATAMVSSPNAGRGGRSLASVPAVAAQPVEPTAVKAVEPSYSGLQESDVFQSMEESDRQELVNYIADGDRVMEEASMAQMEESLDDSAFGIVAGADDQDYQ